MKNTKVRRMVGIAIMSAIVVILQLLGSFIKIGPVSISLVLVPIVGVAAWQLAAAGGVFAAVVLMQPDTAFFYGVHYFGTIITVLVKGILAGWLSGLVFHALRKVNEWFAVLVAAMVCPIVNTGIFALGCKLFFWDALAELGGGNAVVYLFTVMIGFNFVAEFITNLICSPIVVRILHAASKR